MFTVCDKCVRVSPTPNIGGQLRRLLGNRTIKKTSQRSLFYSRTPRQQICSNQMTTALQPMRQRPGEISLKALVNHSLLWERDRLGLFGWLCDTSIDQRKHSLHRQGQNTKSMLPLLPSPSFLTSQSPILPLRSDRAKMLAPCDARAALLFLLSLQVFFFAEHYVCRATPHPPPPGYQLECSRLVYCQRGV